MSVNRVATAAILSGAIAFSLLLSGCGTGTDIPGAPGTAAPSTPASPTPTPHATDDPAPPVPPAVLTPNERRLIEEAVFTKNPADLEPYLADSVLFVLASSDYLIDLAPDALVAEVAPRLESATWSTASSGLIDTARDSSYGPDYFPADVIMLVASDGGYMALSPDGNRITKVLMGINWSIDLVS